jgi:hypothetical protein
MIERLCRKCLCAYTCMSGSILVSLLQNRRLEEAIHTSYSRHSSSGRLDTSRANIMPYLPLPEVFLGATGIPLAGTPSSKRTSSRDLTRSHQFCLLRIGFSQETRLQAGLVLQPLKPARLLSTGLPLHWKIAPISL